MAEVKVGDLRFHVQRVVPRDPTGEVVVYFHGLVIDNLSSFYCTLANPMTRVGAESLLFDMRGHGLSSRPPAGYTIPDLSEDLIGILDACRIERPVHLVANSFGGLVATRTAIAHPDRVASLSMIEGLYGDGWVETTLNALTLTGLNFELDRTIERMAAAGHRKLSRLCSNSDQLLNHTTLIEDLAQTTPEMADLTAVTCPVFAAYGEHSDLLPGVREAASVRPNIRLEVFPGQGHMVLQDETGKLLPMMLDWIASFVTEAAAR